MRQKLALVKSKLTGRISPRLARVRRKIKTGHVGAVFRLFGPTAGIKTFWKSPLGARSWYDVDMRLHWMEDHHPDRIADFVATAIAETTDASTLLGLAQSTVSDHHLRPHLDMVDGLPPEHLRTRLKNSQVFTAAYVGALMFLAGPAAARAADTYARNLHRLPRWNYDRYLDSISFRPAADTPTRSFESGYVTPKSHRLLILESAKSIRDYAHLLRDAASVTIIDMTDMYGKTSFDDVTARGVDTIQIEHIRTRITRFSPEYHALHAQTQTAATHVMGHLQNLQTPTANLFGQAGAHMTLDLADVIFFEALKVRALDTLLNDPRFDHIVVAHQNAVNQPYDRLLSCLPMLRTDARVEFVSTARAMNQRLTARQTIIAATHAPEPASRQIPPLDIADIKTDLWGKVRERVGRIDTLDDDARPRVLMLANHNPAYNPSTAASLAALSDSYQINAIFAGSSISSFLRGSPAAQDAMAHVTPITISHRLLPNLADLSRFLQHHVQTAAQTCGVPDICAVTTAFTGQIVRSSLLPGIADYAFMTGWLEKLQHDDQLPKLAILTPQRSPKLGTLSEAARDFGIPSLALEPHGLNGNYCRYAKVAMDYYGVISDYFRNSAEADFGIAKDRCRVIGSPRIIAPADYDPLTAQSEARATLEDAQPITFVDGQHYGSFFCQPSQWAHTAKVWTNTLQATKDMNVTLLLKTHPEESKARVARYLAIAADLGAADRVVYLEGAPDTIIAASDFVLTGYSAAAIDAAVLQKPILCVTAEDTPYPVDQHEIVHTTLCGDVDTLRTELTLLLTDPAENAKRTKAFLTAEPQFVSGPDAYLQGFVADILNTPSAEALRKDDQRPASLFLDGPFTPFSV